MLINKIRNTRPVKQVASLLIAVSAVALTACDNESSRQAEGPNKVLFFIGDGMGPAFVSGYRYYADNPNSESLDAIVFDEMLVGTATTYPDDETLVTDSAASATALASGIKSYNGAVGVDANKKPTPTMLELAKSKGWKTGVISTSQVNHATPASFIAHVESRRNYNEIADQYFDDKLQGQFKFDLMLGGGESYFKREDRNLVEEFQNAGFNTVFDMNELNKAELPLLGLFAPVGMPYGIDTEAPNRLEVMTKHGINKMHQTQSNFFLMIEGSQIDWCAHGNDIACAMVEMKDFVNAIAYAKQYVDQNPDTLLIVTADHSTGGLTLGANGDYQWYPEKVKQFTQSAESMTKAMLENPGEWQSVWDQSSPFELSDEQKAAFEDAMPDPRKLHSQIVKAMALITNTGWTTTGHTADDVAVYAYGRGAEQFAVQQDNTEIAKKLLSMIGH